MAVSNKAAQSADLPIIEMPKYVITGVEQATALSGRKIPTEATSRFHLPDLAQGDRPAISLDILDTPADRPALLRPVGGEFTEVEGVSGGFGKALGRFATAYEGPQTGYYISAAVDRYPRRTSTGPKTEGSIKGSGVRWIGQETTIVPAIELSNESFVRKDLAGTERNGRFGLGLQVGITPLGVYGGRLAGGFLFDLTMLDKHRDILASHDLLTLEFSGASWQGWLESKLRLEAEAVSTDKSGHSHTSIESVYSRLSGERLLWRAGIIGYTGQVIKTPVILAPGASEGRAGVGLLAGLTWQLSPRSTFDFDFLPQPRFESFGAMVSLMMALDSTARGVTVEVPFHLRMRVSHILSETARLRLSVALLEERHRPFWVVTPAGSWRIETRNTQIETSRLEFEFEPQRNMLVSLFGVLTEASSSGRDGGIDAPFISPAEVGSDVVLHYGKVAIENNLNWTRKTPIAFMGPDRSSHLIDWNISARWSARPGLSGRVGIDNLLDKTQWKIPGYMLPPLTVWAGVEWRGGEAVW